VKSTDGAHSTVNMGMVGAVGHILGAGASKKCAKNHSGKCSMRKDLERAFLLKIPKSL